MRQVIYLQTRGNGVQQLLYLQCDVECGATANVFTMRSEMGETVALFRVWSRIICNNFECTVRSGMEFDSYSNHSEE